MTKHTPGPWEVNTDGEDVFVLSTYTAPDRPHGTFICGQVNNDGDPENLANAELIAAAPELLAACNAVLDYLEGDEWLLAGPTHQVAIRNELMDQLYTTVAKAVPDARGA